MSERQPDPYEPRISATELAAAETDVVQRLARWLRKHGVPVRLAPRTSGIFLRQRRAIAVARACKKHVESDE